MTADFARSWIEPANAADNGFPLANLPFCAFEPELAVRHIGVGIGDQVLDLERLSQTGLLDVLPEAVRSACRARHVNRLMEAGMGSAHALRQRLTHLLSEDATAEDRERLAPCLRPMSTVRFAVPVCVGGYTDFYASVHHATNVGRLFRPDQPLLPNYKWVPIGYHGRASSILVSDTPIRRPMGQIKLPQAETPSFGLTRQLDFELELSAVIGLGNPLGMPVPIADAESRIFGYTLLNDWSARDIQAWEYQPLGPFLGKNFATSVSPWIVTTEAVAPYRTALAPRSPGDPEPLPYLQSPHAETAALDLTLEVHLTSARMREQNLAPTRLSRSNTRDLYWSFAQMVAHHTVNGCNLQTGDLLASGTISGATSDSLGSLLEITQRGAHPLTLPTVETRDFLEDGDEVILRGFCEREGAPRISLGECRGTILPAAALS